MTSSVTHFEIYGEDPAKLAEFYQDAARVADRQGARHRLLAHRHRLRRVQRHRRRAVVPADPGPAQLGALRPRRVARSNRRADRGARRCGGATEDRGAEGGVVRRRRRPRGKHLRHLAGRPVGDAAARTRSLSRKQKRETDTRRRVHALHRRRAVSREHATADHHRGAVRADVAAGRRARHPRHLGRAGQGGGGLLQRRRQGLAPPRAQPRDRAPLRGHRTLQLHDGAPQGSRAPR